MFRCQFSGKQVPEGIKPVKVVTKRRAKTYENFVNKRVKVSYGYENVVELLVAPDEVEACRRYNPILGEANNE